MPNKVNRDRILIWARERVEVEIPWREGGWTKGMLTYIEGEDMVNVYLGNMVSVELGDGQLIRKEGREYIANLK